MIQKLPELTGELMIEIMTLWETGTSWEEIASDTGLTVGQATEFGYRMGIRTTVAPHSLQVEARRKFRRWDDDKKKRFRDAWIRGDLVEDMAREFDITCKAVRKRVENERFPRRKPGPKKGSRAAAQLVEAR